MIHTSHAATATYTRHARRWWRQIGVGVFSLVIALGLGLGAAPVAADEEDDNSDPLHNDNDFDADDADDADPEARQRGDDNDDGVTARFREDTVTVPALWVTFLAEESETHCRVEDPLTDRLRVAYLHSALPADFGVRLSLTAERKVGEREGEVVYAAVETLELSTSQSPSQSAAHTFDWVPPRAGEYRLQLVLEVTEVPGLEPGMPRPNPERLHARSPWHYCSVEFAHEEPALAVVDAQVEARWLPQGPAAPPVAEVTLRVSVRSQGAASLRSVSRFEYAEEPTARWRALLPPAGQWHNSRTHTATAGATLTVERRFRFAQAHWPATLALQLEREDVAPQQPRRLALLELEVAKPSEFALTGTLTRFLPNDEQRRTEIHSEN